MKLSFEDKQLLRLMRKRVGAIVGLIVACKLTAGLATIALALWGFKAASTNKLGPALSCYVLIPFMIILNPYVANIGGMGTAILRLGFMIMTVMLMLSATGRPGNQGIPFEGLWLYAIVACISSMGGYAPLISYLKLFNFSFFLLGIWLGLRNIDKNPEGLMYLRSVFLAMAVVIIFGSIATLAFPGVAYFASNEAAIREWGIEGANAAVAAQTHKGLLCGITNQSQCLGPLSVMTVSWVLCDMLFVEHRMTKLHGALVCCGIPLLYLTRSRTALFALLVALFIIQTYCFNAVRVSARVKKVIMSGMMGVFGLIALAAVVAEVKDHSITRWIRKKEDLASDNRSLKEALTSSRMGLVEQNMYDFRRNPMFGSGFQVAYDFKYRYKPGQFVMSAPIEKGVLPTMILGETGVAGAIAFAVFLLMFYGVCTAKRYAVTATLFTVLMASNMGEATFFSTGGVGGILWVMGIVGGFCIDMIVRARKNMPGPGPVPGMGMRYPVARWGR